MSVVEHTSNRRVPIRPMPRPGYGRPMRDGAPLPGRTPAQVLSQLAHRVFGPLQPARTRIVLDYHGMLNHPAGSLVQSATRHHVTSRTVSNNVAAVRAAGVRLPLSDSDLAAALITTGCTPGQHGQWHLPTGVVAPERYQVIVTLATGRDLTRAEMIDILLTVGYRKSSATGRMSSSHPLFRRTAPDTYRLVRGG